MLALAAKAATATILIVFGVGKLNLFGEVIRLPGLGDALGLLLFSAGAMNQYPALQGRSRQGALFSLKAYSP